MSYRMDKLMIDAHMDTRTDSSRQPGGQNRPRAMIRETFITNMRTLTGLVCLAHLLTAQMLDHLSGSSGYKNTLEPLRAVGQKQNPYHNHANLRYQQKSKNKSLP